MLWHMRGHRDHELIVFCKLRSRQFDPDFMGMQLAASLDGRAIQGSFGAPAACAVDEAPTPRPAASADSAHGGLSTTHLQGQPERVGPLVLRRVLTDGRSARPRLHARNPPFLCEIPSDLEPHAAGGAS